MIKRAFAELQVVQLAEDVVKEEGTFARGTVGSPGATEKPHSRWYADPKTARTSLSPTNRSWVSRLSRSL